MLSTMAPVMAVLLAIGLLLVGLTFMTNAQSGFKLSGHEEASLPAVMGGRYVGLAVLIGGLMALGEFRALALAFAIGAGFGFFDAYVTAKVGGVAKGHLAAGSLSGLLALYYFYVGFPALLG